MSKISSGGDVTSARAYCWQCRRRKKKTARSVSEAAECLEVGSEGVGGELKRRQDGEDDDKEDGGCSELVGEGVGSVVRFESVGGVVDRGQQWEEVATGNRGGSGCQGVTAESSRDWRWWRKVEGGAAVNREQAAARRW